MKRAILLLSLALVAQLALALGLRLVGNDLAATGGGPLLTLAAEGIDRLQIDDGGAGEILLQKVDGSWRLPDHFGAPADGAKIEGLLTTLSELRRDAPVATSDAAFKRFKVTDRDYERRLRFVAGDDTLATLLLGSSSGFRKVHARLAGESQAFDIPFSVWQASLKAEDWVDKTPLHLAPEQIQAVVLPDCRLVRAERQLQVADLDEAHETDSAQAAQLLERLARLSIVDVQARSDQPLPGPALLNLTLELADGATRRYTFAAGKDGNHALLQVSDAPYVYKVAPALLEQLQAATRATLVTVKASQEPTPAPSPTPKPPRS